MNIEARENTYHYGVMRRAIELIDDGGEDLPLDQLAARMDMSSAHFQRVFSAWVGVSPKRYQQYLRLGHAKALLRERFTMLEASHAVGLSGSGRLHDLFLRWEAMSPGEYARKGDGLRIFWGWFESPFGLALVMGTDKGICGLAFAAETGAEPAMADMRARWPQAEFIEDPSALRPQAQAAFAQKGETAVHMIGAPLQIKVWEALLRIPSGHVTTYSELAQAIGSPKASARRGHGGGAQPGQLADPLPPRLAQVRSLGRLPLGAAGQTRDACFRGGKG